MTPTGRQIALWCVPLVLSILAVGADLFVPAVIAFDAVFLVVLVVDALRARVVVTVGRSAVAIVAVGGRADVEITLDNRSRRAVALEVDDSAPGTTTGLPVRAVVPPDGRLVASYALRLDERGTHRFGDVLVSARSPWGFWSRTSRHAIETVLKVFPSFRQLQGAGLASRLAEQRVPARARRRAGGENEFQRLRPYVAGDPYRHVDWNATARYRRPITREFGQESNQNVVFLLDAGRMMSAPMGQSRAFDHALDAALLLAQTALRKGDRVGLLAYDDRVRAWVEPRAGRTSSRRLIQATFDLQPSLREPDPTLAYRHLAARVRRRSLIVLFTTLADTTGVEALLLLVRGLARRHVPLVVWLRDPAVERLAEQGDLYEATAAAEVLVERASALQALERAGARLVDTAVDDLTPALVARYVEIKSRRLL